MKNVLLLAVAFAMTSAFCFAAIPPASAPAPENTNTKTAVSAPISQQPSSPDAVAHKPQGPVSVIISTNYGDITVELDAQKAPITVANFLKYVDEKFYDGTVFHRVIKNFMIQGGGFDQSLSQKKTHAPIKNEAGNGLKNNRGTIAMARTMIVDSATAQFFINTVDNDFLNHRNDSMQGFGYAVFGKVTDGMNVVDVIAGVNTGRVNGMSDVPTPVPVIIKSVRRK